MSDSTWGLTVLGGDLLSARISYLWMYAALLWRHVAESGRNFRKTQGGRRPLEGRMLCQQRQGYR